MLNYLIDYECDFSRYCAKGSKVGGSAESYIWTLRSAHRVWLHDGAGEDRLEG